MAYFPMAIRSDLHDGATVEEKLRGYKIQPARQQRPHPLRLVPLELHQA
jgi:hypothetical protein